MCEIALKSLNEIFFILIIFRFSNMILFGTFSLETFNETNKSI